MLSVKKKHIFVQTPFEEPVDRWWNKSIINFLVINDIFCSASDFLKIYVSIY